jgi:hypothetical protein
METGMMHLDMWWNEGDNAVVASLITKDNQASGWIKAYADVQSAADDALDMRLVKPSLAEEIRALPDGFLEVKTTVILEKPKELSRWAGWLPFKWGGIN